MYVRGSHLVNLYPQRRWGIVHNSAIYKVPFYKVPFVSPDRYRPLAIGPVGDRRVAAGLAGSALQGRVGRVAAEYIGLLNQIGIAAGPVAFDIQLLRQLFFNRIPAH